MRPQTNASLREYARLEYRNEDVQWLLASLKPARKVRQSHRRLGLFARPAPQAARPVACKGSPRRASAEGTAPG